MADSDAGENPAVKNAVKKIRSEGSDILVYCGEVTDAAFYSLLEKINKHAKSKNLLWLLGTNGGDPDAAYRIMRCLQSRYAKITMIVPRYCKSAGTLMAIGADVLVMPDNTELGPIDMQVAKHDELFDQASSLTPQQSLDVLASSSFRMFERHFFTLRKDTLYQLTSKTCADIAARLTIGMFEPIYAQIDPMRIAEMHRALTIAKQYGERLNRNLKPNALDHLVSAYPSHEFVIDRQEAMKLFRTVRPPTSDENELIDAIVAAFAPRMSHSSPEIHFLDEPDDQPISDGDARNAQHTPAPAAADSGPGAKGPSGDDRPPAGPSKQPDDPALSGHNRPAQPILAEGRLPATANGHR